MAHTAVARIQGSPGNSPEPTGRGAAYSLPNSQDSSLNDSSNSEQSHIPLGSSTEEFHISYDTHLHGAMTPSTTVSNKSSQEVAGLEIPLIDQDAMTPQEKLQSANVPVPTQLNHAFSESHNGYTSAPKRMANGDIKSPGNSLPTSPVDASQYGHSRNSSRTSRGSQISDLSSQLRTRLSYAMVKVQNGWQSHNINELEFMTSNQASPTSALSDQRQPYDSLLVNELAVERSRNMQPSCAAIAPREYDRASAEKTRVPACNFEKLEQQGHSMHQLPPTQIGASYESFWREHEGSSTLKHHGAKSPPLGGPSLAPPVDITPRNARRADSAGRQPPPLHTRGLHSAGSQATPFLSTLPATPPPKRTPKFRTPSQQAAVEKDAVETLLFMSSPGNSGHHPPATLSGAPLRSGLAPQASQNDHLGTIGMNGNLGHDTRPGGIDTFSPRASWSKYTLSDAEIDKMLDEMPEMSSSDEDELRDPGPLQPALGR